MKKLLSALLTLVLALLTAAPALAWAEPEVKYASFEAYLDFYRAQEDPDTRTLTLFLDQYLAAHPDALTDFDPYAWFEANLASPAGVTVESWFAWQRLDYTPAHFRAEMTNLWLTGLYAGLDAPRDTDPPLWALWGARLMDEPPSLERYLAYMGMSEAEYAAMAAWAAWAAAYLAAHPEEAAAFDPDDYYLDLSGAARVPDKADWGGALAFASYQRYVWLRQTYLADREKSRAEWMAAQYPDIFAAFDADAWYRGSHGDRTGISSRDYMQREGLSTQAEFHWAMFREWVLARSTHKDGLTVLVDGAPVLVWLDGRPAYPYAVNGRIMVPPAALAETMGFTAVRGADGASLVCIRGKTSVRFVAGATECTVFTDGKTRILPLDVPPVTFYEAYYVPLRALTEALGCGVDWNAPFQTACVTTNPGKA